MFAKKGIECYTGTDIIIFFEGSMGETQKKSKKKLLGGLVLLTLAALLISYFTWWPLPVEAAYEFDLETKDLVLTIEEGRYGEAALSYGMTAKSEVAALRGRKAFRDASLQWSSSDPAVATVDEQGRIRAVEEGEALITAAWGALSRSCPVKVYYPLKGIALSESKLILNKEEEASLSCGPVPVQAEITEPLSYRSLDTRVATVDETGRVRAESVGSTIIVASSGDFTAECEVTVLSPMRGIRLQKNAFTLNVDQTQQLEILFEPEDTTDDKTLIWESLSPKLAQVDQQGLVKALMPGEAKIIARAGAFETTARFTIKAPLKGLIFREEEKRLIKGESAWLRVFPDPWYSTDQVNAQFSSSNPEIVSVDEKGHITALAPGEARITARSGRFSASCLVTVRVPMEGIAIREEGGDLVRGTQKQLTAVFLPEDTNDDRKLIWESSDESVLKVTQEGLVEALAAGEAEVRMRCGEFSAALPFTVIVPVSGVELDQAELEIKRGESALLTARVLPEDTTEDKSIYFASSNEGVARVDGEGRVWGMGPGACEIYARHGDFAASCQVKVTAPLTGISLDQRAITLLEGRSSQLQVSFDPWDTTDSRAVSWSSSNTAVAGVDAEGNIRANGPGDCRITATVGAFSASAEIHVNPYIPVQSVSLSSVDISFYHYGEGTKLEARVEPANATYPGVSWSSSDPSVVSVSEDGRVVALKSGVAHITAKAEDRTAGCVVYVNLPPPAKVVVLDPGHGGIFDGAIYEGRYERQMNLTTAIACKNYLEANYEGVEVHLTRSGDASLSENLKADLYNRAAYAKQMGATILVSLHYNASLFHDASGVAVYASFDPRVGDDSQALASVMVNQLAAYTGLSNGGVRLRYYDEVGLDTSMGDYYGIIRHSAGFGIPAVLVEHCHMDYDIWCIDSEEDLIQFGIQDAIAIARYLGLPHK